MARSYGNSWPCRTSFEQDLDQPDTGQDQPDTADVVGQKVSAATPSPPPRMAATTSSAYLEMVLMSVAFMAMTLIIFILYGLAAHSVNRQLANAPKGPVWLQRSFAATFAPLASSLP